MDMFLRLCLTICQFTRQFKLTIQNETTDVHFDILWVIKDKSTRVAS